MSSILNGPHDYANPPSIGWQIDVTALTTLMGAFICVTARTYTKTRLTYSFGREDYFSLAALAVAIGRTVIEMLGTHVYGLGRHFVNIPPKRLNGYLTIIAVDGYLYIIVMMLAKLSLLLFLYRIFKVDTKFRYTTWIVGTIIVLWSVISVLLSIFSCRPLTASWNLAERLNPKTVCNPEIYTVINYYGFCNIITDFALILMPMPLLYHIHMGTAKKIGTACVFATGLVILAIAIRRQYVLLTTSQATDPSWQIVPSIYWMIIEVNLAIICACLPTLQPLFRRICPCLINLIPTSIRSKFSGHSAMENAPWPSKLRGPGGSKEGERRPPVPTWGRVWREWEEGSVEGSEGSSMDEQRVGMAASTGLKPDVETGTRGLRPLVSRGNSRVEELNAL